MIENYQEEQELEIKEPIDQNFATIGAIYSDGVTLIFDSIDGTAVPTKKHYKCNSFCVFKAGDRVRIIKDSGTYVVEYPIGKPKTTFNADTATNATTATSAATATNAVTANTSNTATTATNFSSSHTGNKIAFFGGSLMSKASGISTVATNASLSTLITEWNQLIKALDYRGYNLIE